MGYNYLYSTDGEATPLDLCLHVESVFEADDEFGLQDVARDAADDFYRNHDGWEVTWPLTFSIFTVKGKHLGNVGVELDFDPMFYTGVVLFKGGE